MAKPGRQLAVNCDSHDGDAQRPSSWKWDRMKVRLQLKRKFAKQAPIAVCRASHPRSFQGRAFIQTAGLSKLCSGCLLISLGNTEKPTAMSVFQRKEVGLAGLTQAPCVSFGQHS